MMPLIYILLFMFGSASIGVLIKLLTPKTNMYYEKFSLSDYVWSVIILGTTFLLISVLLRN